MLVLPLMTSVQEGRPYPGSFVRRIGGFPKNPEDGL